MEQQIIAWLAAHPFVHSELLLIVGAISGLAKADWERFKEHKEGDPEMSFLWSVALRQYSKAIVLAAVPPLVAAVWRILGS